MHVCRNFIVYWWVVFTCGSRSKDEEMVLGCIFNYLMKLAPDNILGVVNLKGMIDTGSIEFIVRSHRV